MKKHERKYLKNYREPEYLVNSIDLKFDLEEEKTTVTSLMKIRRNHKTANETTPLVLDCKDLEITSVVAGGMVLLKHEYETGEDYFKLNRVPEKFTLEITTLLKPSDNTSLEGLYKSGTTFCTQCEAEGFRKITCFPDRPDVMTKFSCIITADKEKYPVLLSNGNLINSGELANNRHFVKWEDPFKKPSYLFALVAGDLVCIEDNFKTCSNRNTILKIYVEKENIDKCDHAMKSLKQAMKWDEEEFGREYDLDLYQIVAVNDFNMGAMENKGLNIFNSRYVLAKHETATDNDFLNIQAVIAHEYFHNWTGNRITLQNWFQLSLKEGLTVFRDQEFSSDMNSRGVKRINDVKKLRAHQFPEDAGPMSHPVRPESYIEMNNFYTLTVYEKGSEIIRMIFQLLGKKLFRKGMDLYFERFDGQAVTTEDFVKTMEDASGIDLSQFRLWYSQSGTPTVSMTRSYDPETKKLAIDLCQHIPAVKENKGNKENIPAGKDQNEHSSAAKDQSMKQQPMHIPVKIGFIDKNGHDITPHGKSLLNLKYEKESFVFENIDQGTIPSLFREFSAPVKIKTDFKDRELAFLMAHDTDEFNRWDAAQQLFLREIKSIVERIKQNKNYQLSSHVTKAFKLSLCNAFADQALIAKTLTLPGENEIGEEFKEIDVDAVHKARCFVKKSLAIELENDFLSIISQCNTTAASDISSRAMAERSLKNLALSYIGALEKEKSSQMIHDRFMGAANMTDEIATLAILADIDSNLCKDALEKFYLKWKSDLLVIDKWFSVQAGSTLPNTLENVKKLACHQDFSLKNPNRIRALTGVFATQNPVNFHRADGKGYRYLANQIIELDSINPQISARLVSAFNNWKRYDKKRQILMQKELEKIMGIPVLSKDTYEIISKALDQE